MSARVGIVVVSHSRALADAAVSLALEMAHEVPTIEVAAGTADGGTGTDASRVAQAIAAADSGGGVVVVTDLGSAVLSAEMALEFIDASIEVRLVPAPFVEGILAAVVRAGAGARLDEVAAEASRALAPKVQHLGDAAPDSAPGRVDPGQTRTVTVRNVDGIHARPAAAIVGALAHLDADVLIRNRAGAVADAASPIALATLGAHMGEVLTIAASGADAARALDALTELFATGFGEETATPQRARGPASVAASHAGPSTQTTPSKGQDGAHTTRALGVSPGRAVGPVRCADNAVQVPDEHPPVAADRREQEAARAIAAFHDVALELDARAARVEGQRSHVVAATAAIARDPELHRAISAAIGDHGATAEWATWTVADGIADRYRAAGGLIAERVTDVLDVRDRVVRHLRGQAGFSATVSTPHVLVAVDLAPADTADLDPSTCLAIVTERGAPTSHTAIIARELGIPAVVGFAGASAIPDGTIVWVDGTTGEVVLNPDAAVRASVTERDAIAPLRTPTATRDGVAMPLLANVAGPRETSAAVEWGAEGVGLFRTEFCFLDRVVEPTVAEQVAHYRTVLEAFPQRRVVVRTLDAGSDKPLAFITADAEPNPALGVRGYRTVRIDKAVLARQLDAIVAAMTHTQAEVWVMAPMVSTVDEAAAFVEAARVAGVVKAGVMIETPSAAIMARELCEVVDFVSLGTNDLTQYTMAADRMTPALTDLADAWQPAVLRLIGMVGSAGAATRTPVGVCGEAASQPDLAPVLVGLGATSLSMTARSLPRVAPAISAVTVERCREAANAALLAHTSAAARRAAANVLASG